MPKRNSLGFYWLLTLAICLVQVVLYAFDRSSGMGIGIVISLVWLLTVCIAVSERGPVALWLFITLPLGAPLVSALLYRFTLGLVLP